MKLIDTARGLVEASRLIVNTTEQDAPCGKITATEYRLNGELVKRDVHVDIREDAMPPGFAAADL